MIPLFVLLISFAVLRAIGWFGVHAVDSFDLPLRIALCLIFPIGAWGFTELLTQLALLGILGMRFVRSGVMKRSWQPSWKLLAQSSRC